MKYEKLKKQVKKLSKYLPKEIILVTDVHSKERELTEDEIKVIKGYFQFYQANGWIPVYGMIIKHISKKSYLDFEFMNLADSEGNFCIYLTLK